MTTLLPVPQHGQQLVDVEGRAKTGFQLFLDAVGLNSTTGRVNLLPYTVAALPAASVGYGMIMVTDETGGPVPAYSDLTNWRRVTDGAIVS